MTSYCKRYTQLAQGFRPGTDYRLEDSGVEVRFLSFLSTPCGEETDGVTADISIGENFTFLYPLFCPPGTRAQDRAILLLHGLNERNWNKYLAWAEFLCLNTEKPVILFPIAYHINRSPLSWSNPRNLTQLLDNRKQLHGHDRSISFANVALSERISHNPERFYLSGRQTWEDLTALFEEIKTGRHPLFREATQIDIFAYSIGAFLSQILLMANRKNLFSDSRLFMFCGGSIFRSMCGISRSILDKAAFEALHNYYIHTFGNEPTSKWRRDEAFEAFCSMISPERRKTERENIFTAFGKKIRGIALAQDTVIPYRGVSEALGKANTLATIKLMDFDYPYTHENPFPHNTADTASVDAAFTGVFSRAVDFLC